MSHAIDVLAQTLFPAVLQKIWNAMFAFGGPLLGNFESGLVASLTSPQFSIISGGVACILATLAIVAIVPGLMNVNVKAVSS